MSRLTAACTRLPTEMLKNGDSFRYCLSVRLRFAHAIADATHGMNELNGKGFVDFATQVAHVHIDDIRYALETLVPDMIENHGSRENSAGRAKEVFEERVFLCGEVDSMTVAPDLLGEAIELQVRNAQYIGTLDRCAAQKRLDTHQQFSEIERLGEV